MKSTFFRFLFCLATGVIFAQQPIPKDSITQLDEVILLETLKKKNTIGITNSTIVGAKTFQNYSPVSMVSSLNETPGVYVFSGAINTNRITIRGIGARTLFGTNKLRMYYNDIPITNGAGASEIEAYDIENISQIEIVKGPKATAFGTNLGGAILLTSKEALGKSTNFSNNFTVGDFGLVKNNLSFNHKDNKLQIGLQYGHTQIKGYRENSNFERDGVLLNTSYTINAKNKLSLLINHIDYTAQIPSSLGATAFAENPQQATFTWRASQGFEANNSTLVGMSFDHKFNAKLKNTSSVFASYLDHYEARPFGILDEFTNGFGFRTRFSGSVVLFEKPTTFNEDNNGNGSLLGERFAKNKEFRNQLNAFASAEFPFSDALKAQLGLNLNKTAYDYRDFFNQAAENKSARRNFKLIALPSLNLQYSLAENKQLFATISRGFSNPSLEETLTPDGVINPEINQETGTNYELGANGYLFDEKLKFDLAIYQMNVRNLLVAERINDDQFIGKNAGKTKHQGLELAVSYTISPAANISIAPFLSYTFNNHSFVDFRDGDNDFSGNQLTGVPKHELHAGVQMNLFNGFYWNTTYHHLGSIPLTDANSLFSDAFNLVHSRLGYRQKISKKFLLGLAFGINNLFDTTYAQSVLINTRAFGGREPRYFYPGNKRNSYGSIQLGYAF